MDRNLEIVVPTECAASVEAAFDRVPHTRIVTEPTPKSTVLRMCLATRQAVDRSESDLVSWAAVIRKHVHRDTPFVFLLEAARSVDERKLAQRIALLSASWRSTPYVAPDADVARRLALARLHGAEDKLIASAAIQGDTLEVWSCEPKIYRVRISALPSLSKMPRRVLERFEVSSSGSRLHWAEGDLDLNLDSIHAAVDPRVAKRQRSEFKREARRYGRAIRTLREQHSLRQSDIEGVTERTMRRIELGEVTPHGATLAKLAASHQLALPEYLKAVASSMRRSG